MITTVVTVPEKREILGGNWSLFIVSQWRQTATYTRGCKDCWRQEEEGHGKGERVRERSRKTGPITRENDERG